MKQLSFRNFSLRLERLIAIEIIVNLLRRAAKRTFDQLKTQPIGTLFELNDGIKPLSEISDTLT